MTLIPLHKDLLRYPPEMKIRLMRLLGYVWSKDKCRCGTQFTWINDGVSIKNGWALPTFLEEFSENRNIVRYKCHGCNDYNEYIVEWKDPIYMKRIYDMFMHYNPEIIHEVFKNETEELSAGA